MALSDNSGAWSKVAVVTGASRGIGAGLVEALRGSGYAVVGTSRTIEPGDDPAMIGVAGEIASEDTAERVIRAAVDRFGQVDTLVNNAGIFIAKPFTEYTAEDLRALTSVNLEGFFHITQRAITVMLGQGRGHVINVTTTLVDHADRRSPSALAVLTKGGLDAATRALAVEYADRGIRVNAVAPGVIRTPRHDAGSYASVEGFHPIPRLGEVADIVGAVQYLEQASFVTGETIHVDGGHAAGH